jgi:hypothetical protein
MLFIRSVRESENGFTVDADRLIAVGDIRSAFKFPLNVRVESKARSLSNPYGLLLSNVQTIDKGGSK